MAIPMTQLESYFRPFKRMQFMAVAVCGLVACDIPDVAFTEDEIAVAEAQSPINFNAEVDAATTTCLTALERDQQSDISLARFGYEPYFGGWEKSGPQVQLLGTRSSVFVRFAPSETRQSVCKISITGGHTGDDRRGFDPGHRALVARSASLSERLGFTPDQERVGSRVRETVVKGDTRIAVQARQAYERGVFRLDISYFLDR